MRLLRWFLSLRGLEYVAPDGGQVRCVRGDSVIYGDLVADHGGYAQVMAEGRTLVTLSRPCWTIERL